MTESAKTTAVLSRTALEESDSFVRLHSGQVFQDNIVPNKGGQQHRNIHIGACVCVEGSVMGSSITIQAAENIIIGDGLPAPGTEIQGSINALSDVDIGCGTWIHGGVLATGDVTISGIKDEKGIPGHVLIEGGVFGRNVTIGDGVVILGPVVASKSLSVGNCVTIRDHVRAPIAKIGDGCLIGGLVCDKSITCGKLLTIASSYIILPKNIEGWGIPHSIRSPYNGCDKCPYEDRLGPDSIIARKLACHLHSHKEFKAGRFTITPGECKKWTYFPLTDKQFHWAIPTGEIVVSLVPSLVTNLSIYTDQASIWERGGE